MDMVSHTYTCTWRHTYPCMHTHACKFVHTHTQFPVYAFVGSGDDVKPAFKGEVPEQDVDDDPNALAPTPSAPPLEKMDPVSGYENIGFSEGKWFSGVIAGVSLAPAPTYS